MDYCSFPLAFCDNLALDIDRKSTSESINLLMDSNDRNVNKIVMKFISTCMNIRDTWLLSNEIDVT